MIKIITVLGVLILCSASLIISCTKGSQDVLGVNSCDTTSVQYGADIVPILQANCYRCHGNGNTGGSGGVLLEGYPNLQKWANNGFLAGNVSHAPGYIGMPYGQPKLSGCTVNKIVAWVNQGAKDN